MRLPAGWKFRLRSPKAAAEFSEGLDIKHSLNGREITTLESIEIRSEPKSPKLPKPV